MVDISKNSLIFGGMERSKYYSQTDVLKKYKLSAEQYKLLIDQHQITTYQPKIDLGTYQVQAIYTLKSEIDSLNLELRKKV